MRLYTSLAVFCLSMPALAQSPQTQSGPGGSGYALNTYLNDVKDQHEGLKASRETTAGAEAKQAEADIPYATSIFANSQAAWDKRETANPASLGDYTRQQGATAGLSKLWNTGTVTKLSYGVTQTQIDGANPLFLPTDHFYTAGPTVEVSQPLWKNAGGSETRAGRDLILAQTSLTQFQEAFKTKLTMAESELAYWRLVLSREAVHAQRQSLDRFQKLRAWNAKRVSDALADKADLLQADAAVKGKQLELQMALDEERSAARAFNLGRGKDSDQVPESLTTIDDRLVESIAPPQYKEKREDVKVAEQAARVAEAGLRMGEQKYTPTLEVFGTAGLNGRDDNFGTATKESFQSTNPLFTVGLKLVAPHDGDPFSRAKSAFARDKVAAEYSARRRETEATQQYKDLLAQFADAKSRFKLSESIEAAQREKLEHERQRHRVGRTTTYQVLLFEQDFATSQLARIRTQADVMRISAQLKTFGG